MSARDDFEALQALTLAGASVEIGELAALLHEDGAALVLRTDRPGAAACRAESIVELQASDIGRRVLLTFVGGDARRAVVLGTLKGRADARVPAALDAQVEADGDVVTVSAKQRLVLKCGKASLTLTAAGKILLDGTYVSSRSSGVNRVKGGSVQLN